MDWSIGNILWILIGGPVVGIVAGVAGMFASDWLATLLGVYETGGYDGIRHGLQVAVGVVLVAIVATLFAARSRDVL